VELGVEKSEWRVPYYTGTTAYNVTPEYQNATNGIYNGTVEGGHYNGKKVRMRKDKTYPEVVTQCSTDNEYTESIIVNTSFKTIYAPEIGDSTFQIWCRRNYTAIPDPKKNIYWEFEYR